MLSARNAASRRTAELPIRQALADVFLAASKNIRAAIKIRRRPAKSGKPASPNPHQSPPRKGPNSSNTASHPPVRSGTFPLPTEPLDALAGPDTIPDPTPTEVQHMPATKALLYEDHPSSPHQAR